MTTQEQEKQFASFVERMKKILISKRGDYSNQIDVLSNFKDVATIINSTPDKVCLTHLGTKITRLGVLLSNEKNPNNESIEDSILDLANYAILLSMILSEKQTPVNTSNMQGYKDRNSEVKV